MQVRLHAFAHENVIRMLAVCFKTQPLLIVLEYMPNGDLKSFLRKVQESSGETEFVASTAHLLRLAHDCSKGLAYLQSIKYVHRDIAARNVLLSRTYVAKIGDFGMARKVFQSEVCCEHVCMRLVMFTKHTFLCSTTSKARQARAAAGRYLSGVCVQGCGGVDLDITELNVLRLQMDGTRVIL